MNKSKNGITSGMTDNEIIKALECCGRESCNGCPYRSDRICHQGNPMIRDALDLINRQKAEIERLKGNAPKIFISGKTPSRYFKVKSSQPILIYPYEKTKIELVPSAEQIKSEAIKDFAEKLVHTLVINNEENTEIFDFSYTLETIDNLVKEMIGEQE